ncbi:hypothetical protein ITJ38_00840 [Agreia pratensis]|uniref:hypothetical protein n=1 Tax=Agreia pratensis TaxID=150121 RepID=UPI00188CC23F|nr:hypothetical protein [Agreia pratensis]MBF4632945.1 hypothetical protein [Agreia pratensis]
MRDDTSPVHDDEAPGIPDYGTPGGAPPRVGGPAYGSPRQARPVSDAQGQALETEPGDDEGGLAGFLDAVQDRAQAVLSDLGIGPDDDLPTVSDGVDWSHYPGTRAGDADFALAALSQQETIERNEALLARLRAAITPQFGLSWGLFGEIPRIDSELNDWGGESLLETCTTGTWRSTAKLTNPLVKMQLVDLVTGLLQAEGFHDVTLRNDPAHASGAAALAAVEHEFGGMTLRDQVVWSLVARESVHSRSEFELTIIELKHDRTGRFLEAARARAELRGGPMSSVDLEIVSRGTLPAELEDEFRDRARRYDDREPPAL